MCCHSKKSVKQAKYTDKSTDFPNEYLEMSNKSVASKRSLACWIHDERKESTLFVESKNVVYLCPCNINDMEIVFAKQYLEELYLTGKTSISKVKVWQI